MTPRDRQALGRIIDCVQAIDAYVSRAGADWPTDDMAVDAIAKRIEEIGEVAKRLTPETLATMPSVNWRSVKGMREVIAGVVRDNLPGLRAAVSRTLASS